MSLQVLTIDDVGDLFTQMETRLDEADFSETFREFMPELAQMEAGMFAGEFDSNHDDWPVLKESTIKRKGHDRILVEHGALMKSLTNIGSENNIAEAFEKGMVFGTSDEKAHFHQFGTVKMPPRPPVGITDEVLETLVNRIADRAVEILMEE